MTEKRKITHIKYNKIYALGKDETKGILDEGTITVQEKIDGANTSVWKNGDRLGFGTRNNEITEGFNGFVDYCNNHVGICQCLVDNPTYRLFGEWLVRHTIHYDIDNYNNWFIFDVLDEETGEFLSTDEVYVLANKYGLKTPALYYKGPVISVGEIEKFVGMSQLGPKGEGVVIKNDDYVSRFGVKPQYAKIVTQEFKESNGVVFGGNNKFSDTYHEMWVVNKYITLARVKKIIQKIESAEERAITIADTPRVASSVYHDALTEEIWAIKKKCSTIDFRALDRLAMKKAIVIFHDVLNGVISVAHSDNKDL